MRLITTKNGNSLPYFDKIKENNNDKTSPKEILINNHDRDANKDSIKGELPLEHILGFCRTFKKVTKNLGFHIKFKAADLQDFIYTTWSDDIKIKIITLHL